MNRPKSARKLWRLGARFDLNCPPFLDVFTVQLSRTETCPWGIFRGSLGFALQQKLPPDAESYL